ncbi:MAG: DUF29 domain-containing protein [Alphaproteobacteria bacterium]|nr:DUF29 domain-containing protein [Alphaproteobacteria bacterium]
MRAAPVTATLYDQDFAQWCEEQAGRLRSGRLDALDVENLAEEIESMGKSQQRELASRLQVLLLHLLKQRFQPEHDSRSWRSTIIEQRAALAGLLAQSPILRRLLPEGLVAAYAVARRRAAAETDLPVATFPETCPFTAADASATDE